jgi:hypothetical protein
MASLVINDIDALPRARDINLRYSARAARGETYPNAQQKDRQNHELVEQVKTSFASRSHKELTVLLFDSKKLGTSRKLLDN